MSAAVCTDPAGHEYRMMAGPRMGWTCIHCGVSMKAAFAAHSDTCDCPSCTAERKIPGQAWRRGE